MRKAGGSPLVYVLILGFNDKPFLKEAIESVLNQTYPNYKLQYIDNHSSDGSGDFVKKNFPNVVVNLNQENVGYAKAYNLAAKKVFSEGADAVVFLNPDVLVDKDWLKEMVNTAFLQRDIGIVQPKIYLWEGEKTKRINSLGNEIHYLGVGYCGDYKQEDDGSISDKEITFASGCSMLVKKEAFLSTGGFDENFFCYVEDQDLCWRAKMYGFKSFLSAKSVMWHKYSFNKGSNNQKLYLLERNRLFFIAKDYQFKTIILLLPVGVFMELSMLIDSIFRRSFLSKIKSYYDFWFNLGSVLKERRKIQNNRKLSDRELFPYLNPKIDFQEVNSPLLTLANSIFTFYYKIIRRFV